MEDKNVVMVPFYVHQDTVTWLNITNKRLWILCILLVLLLVGTNAGWLYYESQWETVETTTITQDLDAGDGGNAVISDGVHINGESTTNSNQN